MVLGTSRIDPVVTREMGQVYIQMSKVSPYNNLPVALGHYSVSD